MALQSLVLCQDQEVLRLVRSILQDLGVGLEACAEPDDALARLAQRKFEVVVVDFQTTLGDPEMLTTLRQTKSNATSIFFLIGPQVEELRSGLELGADFVIQRPISLEQAWRSFRAARNLMEREQRRYYRAPLEAGVRLRLAEAHELDATAVNLSLGGLAIQSPQPLPAGQNMGARFALPGSGAVIEAGAEIAWTDPRGCAGLRFLEMSADCQRELEQWLAERVERREFAFVSVTPDGQRLGASLFRDPSLQERALRGF